MKVVFTTMFGESMGAGMGRVAYEIVEAFAKKHEVLFIYPGKRTKKTIRKNLWLIEVGSKGEGDVVIPNLDFKNITFIFRNLEQFSPEVVHAQDYGPLSFLLRLWANKNKIPFVYTSHVLPTKISDFGAKEISEKMGKIFDSKILRKYFLNFFKNCDGVIALNEKARKDILKFGYKGKIFNVPNGRNLKLYQLKKTIGSRKERKLLSVGWLSRRKNQKYLLQMMSYLPKNYILELIGSAFEERYLLELKNYVRQNGLKNVIFSGKLEHEIIPKRLKETFVYVSASKMEVQSLSIIEALTSGTPVIGLSNETIDEFVDNTVGFNLPKKTPPKIFAQKIMTIANLPHKDYVKMCQDAKKKVEYLDWVEIVKKTSEVYRHLITSKSKTRSFSETSNKNTIRELSDMFRVKKLARFKINKFVSGEINKFVSGEIKSTFYDLNVLLLVVLMSLGGSFYDLINIPTSLRKKLFLKLLPS